MKNLILLFITLLTLISCQENEPRSVTVKDNALAALRQSRKDNFGVEDMLYKFQINLTAIYGEAFTNKAWH